MTLSAAGIECDQCHDYVHYSCTNLPVYQIIQFKKSSRQFTCLSCVHSKFKESFVPLANDIQKAIQDHKSLLNPTQPGTPNNQQAFNNDPSESETAPTPVIQPEQSVIATASNTDNSIQIQDPGNLRQDVNLPPTNPQSTIPARTINHEETRLPATSNATSSQIQSLPNPNHTTRTAASINELNNTTPQHTDPTPCKFYMQGHCRYGNNGLGCRFPHPSMCYDFLRHGNSGCSRGIRCKYIHPKLCGLALRNGFCHRKKCYFYHSPGTKESSSTNSSPDHHRITPLMSVYTQGLPDKPWGTRSSAQLHQQQVTNPSPSYSAVTQRYNQPYSQIETHQRQPTINRQYHPFHPQSNYSQYGTHTQAQPQIGTQVNAPAEVNVPNQTHIPTPTVAPNQTSTQMQPSTAVQTYNPQLEVFSNRHHQAQPNVQQHIGTYQIPERSQAQTSVHSSTNPPTNFLDQIKDLKSHILQLHQIQALLLQDLGKQQCHLPPPATQH